MELSDREIVCTSCGQPFLFTGGEQGWYASKGMQEPRRCKPCRAQRKVDGGAAPVRSANPQGGNVRRSAPPRRPAFAMAAPDDPNGYRAPGFQSDGRPAYAIDYAGLPRDEEDGSDAPAPGNERTPANAHVDRFGMRTAPVAVPSARPMRARTAGPARGTDVRRMDRAGTDPHAYRAPGFAAPPTLSPRPRSDAPETTQGATPGGMSRRDRRAQRARFEAVCADCGVDALVPFQPADDRPAYCKTCYQTRKANGTIAIPAPGNAAAFDRAPVVTD